MSTYRAIYQHVVTAVRDVYAEDVQEARQVADEDVDLPTPGSKIGDEYDAAGEWELVAIEQQDADADEPGWSQFDEDDARERERRAEVEQLRAEVERLRAVEQRAEALRARWIEHSDQTIARAMLHVLGLDDAAPAPRAVTLDPDDPQQMRALHDALVRADGVMGPGRLADALRALRDGSAR